MNIGDIPHLMGPFLMVQLASAALGLLAAVVVAVRLVQRRPTAVALSAIPVLLPACVVFASSLYGLAGATGADAHASMAINIGSRLIGWVWMWPATAVVLLACVVSSLRAPRRRIGVAAGVLLLGLLTAALPWVYGMAAQDYTLAAVRSVLYALVAVLVGLAAVGDDEDATLSGPEAGATAGVVGLWFVAGGEMFSSGLAYAGLAAEMRGFAPEYIDDYLTAANAQVFDKMAPWDLVTVAAMTLCALVAVGAAGMAGQRRVRALTALPIVILAPVFFAVGSPSADALRALFHAMQ
ncbi:MAG: hypothetical protein KC912_04090 [Proteobacteria bacterium]|nr:hypothetical protein [Pseudomonadota bacterium]